MRQAQTLNEAQLRRVIKYTRSRRHQVRDETIILTSFYAGLRAKEIAALTVGNVFDEEGNVRSQFILSAAQSKGGQTRTVYLNQRFRKALLEYSACIRITDPQRPLFVSQKAATSQPTPCVSCSWTFTKQWGSRMRQAIREDALTSRGWPTKAWGCAC